MPALPTETSATSTLLSAISSNIPLTPTPTSIKTPTKTPPSPTPTLGVGSTMVSEKDGMVMVYVPGGEFQMGSEGGETDEKPIHAVYLDSYWIDQTEVTNAMFATFLNAKENQNEGGKTWLNATESDVRIQILDDTWQAISVYEDHPVFDVTWYGAQAYCKWVGRRLPTEAEWEKAAGWDEVLQTQRAYPWGNGFDCQNGNFNNPELYIQTNENEFVLPMLGNCDVFNSTAPVGSFLAGVSFYGALDMAGNVWEWVADWYDENYYVSSPSTNPQGPLSGSTRVLRGGSWNNLGGSARSAARHKEDPTASRSSIGFRCARDADSP